MGTRSREYGPKIPVGVTVERAVVTDNPLNWITIGDTSGDSITPGSQVTESQNNPGWRKNLGKGDVGGSFKTVKRHLEADPVVIPDVYYGDYPYHYRYNGPVYPWVGITGHPLEDPVHFPDSGISSGSSLDELGTKAIARCEPTRSVAELSTATGEFLKEGIPRIPLIKGLEKRARTVINAGDEYLNYAFGWVPLVNDVVDTAKFIQKHDKLISQFERDSGRPVRRQFRFPIEKPEVEIEGVYENATLALPTFPWTQYHFGPKGVLTVTKTTSREVWFSGSFTYYLPSSLPGRSGIGDSANSARQLLGAKLNPEVLWNLTPWSWAIDWFSNTGDYFSNLSAFAENGLVMNYGYVMEKSIVTRTFRHSGPSGLRRAGGGAFPTSVSVSYITESKQRREATPYGFGISLESLTGFQQSILVALGLSKL